MEPLSPRTETHESNHWTRHDDERLLEAVYLKGKVMSRVGKTVVGSWSDVAKEMGFEDVSKGSRRCSRRWFSLNPNQSDAALQVLEVQKKRNDDTFRSHEIDTPDIEELLASIESENTETIPAVVEALQEDDTPLECLDIFNTIEVPTLRLPRRARRSRKPNKVKSLNCNETLDWESAGTIPPIGKVGLTFTFKKTNLDVVYRFWSTRYAKELCGNVKEKQNRVHSARLARIRKLRSELQLQWQDALFAQPQA